MTQYWPAPTTIPPGDTSGTELADIISQTLAAIRTQHSGTSRPSYAVDGTIWIDTSGGVTNCAIKLFDGTDDLVIGTFNKTANTVSLSISAIPNPITVTPPINQNAINITVTGTGEGVAVTTADTGVRVTSTNATGLSALWTQAPHPTSGNVEAGLCLGDDGRCFYGTGDVYLTAGDYMTMSGDVSLFDGTVNAWMSAAKDQLCVFLSQNAANRNVIQAWAEHASYINTVQQLFTIKAGAADFNFLHCSSNNQSDPEFRVQGNGLVFADGAYSSAGADYAEAFEWADGNPNKEDRVGYSVSLVGDKIKPAQAGEVVIGVISATATTVGDNPIMWQGKFMTDDFGRAIMEDYDHLQWEEDIVVYEARPEVTREENDEEFFERVKGRNAREKMPRNQVVVAPARKAVIRKKMHSYASDGIPEGVEIPGRGVTTIRAQRRKLNPNYDPNEEYVTRDLRPEWDAVGLKGKVRLRKGQPVDDSWIKLKDISPAVELWLI